MSNRYRVLPYKPGSASAKALAESLDGLRLKTEGKRFRPREEDVVINWGSSKRPPRLDGVQMLNAPEVINKVTDKLAFFEHMREFNAEIVPEFWTNADDIPDSAFPIVCRTIVNGHSGAGIVIANNRAELVRAPLYVKYIKKSQEYRVHVGKVEGRKNPDKVIAVQRKARLRSVPDSEVNWHVRSHANGFVFARSNVSPSARVTDVARRALEATGLDFGAVDVVDSERTERAYVLEINSAPGLEGTTVTDYASFFRNDKGVSHGILPKPRVTRNEEDNTWHAEAPYLDEYGRRRYDVSDFATWGEALQFIGN